MKRKLFHFTVALLVLILPNFIFARGQRLTTDNNPTNDTVRIREESPLERLRARANPKKPRATARPVPGGSAILAQSDSKVTVTDIGPELGVSYAIEGFLINPKDSRQILVPAQNEVFKSFDGGRSWSRISILTEEGFEDAVISMRQDPSNPLRVYAVTNIGILDSRLHRSTDFGDTWAALPNEAETFPSLVDCAVHQTSPEVILLLPEAGDSGTALFRSTDGGASFEAQFGIGLPEAIFDEESEELLADPLFASMATTPADPNLVYVVNTQDLVNSCVDAGGVYKSTDSGISFTRLDGAPAAPRQIFPHPTQSSTIFLQAQQKGSLTDLYRSTDGGESFTEVTAGLPAVKFNFFVAFDPRNPSFVYVAGEGGLFRSTDGGATFNGLGLRQEQIGDGATTLSIDPANSEVIYVNTDQGNFKSVNGGVSFVAINAGWRASVVRHLTFDNHSEPSLYVSTALGNGALKTQSRGAHYEQIAEQITPLLRAVGGLAVAATNRNFIVALTGGGIYRSTDGGHSWTAAGIDTGQKRFTDGKVVIDPTNSSNVYATCASVFLPCSGPQFPGFYRSTDGGQTFNRSYYDAASLNRSALKVLAIDPSNPKVIYTGSRVFLSGGSLLKSTDGGISFSATQLGIRARALDIAIDPQNSQNVYVAGEFLLAPSSLFRYILRSTDGGATFTPADSGLSDTRLVKLLVIDPVNPSRLFAWTWKGLFMSGDNAASWSLLEGSETLLRTGVGTSMAINPKNPNLIYLGGASVLEVEIKQ